MNRKCVLVVEDQEIFAANVTRYLTSCGYDVRTCGTANAACEIATENAIDAAVVDVRLPDYSGVQLAERLRASIPTLPIVVMSGEENARAQIDTHRMGKHVFLVKPFPLTILRDLLLELVPATDRSVLGVSIPSSKSAVIMYSHDNFGVGNLRRNVNIARGLVDARPDANVLLLCSGPGIDLFELPERVDLIKLPCIASAEQDGGAVLPDASTVAIRDLRSRLIERAVDVMAPRVFLVENYPAGVWGELEPVLQAIARMHHPPRVVLGLRDIPDEPEQLRKSWQRRGTYQLLDRCFDDVFVYGHEALFDTRYAYGLKKTRPDLHWCGYVTSPEEILPSRSVREELRVDDQPLILVCAGGGRGGHPLMLSFLAALAQWPTSPVPAAVIVTGPLMPAEQREELRRRAAGFDVRLITTARNSMSLVNAADVVVAMGGYNTVMESVWLGKKLIIVPRAGPRREQRLRAGIVSDNQLATTIAPESLSARTLADSILHHLHGPSPSWLPLGKPGVDVVTQKLSAWLPPLATSSDTARWTEVV